MSENNYLNDLKTKFSHLFKRPHDFTDVMNLPSFYQDLCRLETLYHQSFDDMNIGLQNKFIILRLRQLVDICRLNLVWKKRINNVVGDDPVENLEQFQLIPITQKFDFLDLFGTEKKGLVFPLSKNGFLVAASGGTSSGQPSQIIYSLTELQETYKWAGRFIGRYITDFIFSSDKIRWLGTTLSDNQLWSSGTMVGGVLQTVPNINYLGIGSMSVETFKNIMSYPGEKCLMGISTDIAQLVNYAIHIEKTQCRDLKILLYGSGPLTKKVKNELKKNYPDVKILAFFAATQAETIGLQLRDDDPTLTSIPGLHFIEIVKKDGSWAAPGEVGELVVTRLFGNAAPILRLNLGDRVRRLLSCSGTSLGTVRFEYIGRTSDIFNFNGKSFYLSDIFSVLECMFAKNNLPGLSETASDIQFQLHEGKQDLSLVAAVPEANAFRAQVKEIFKENIVVLNGEFTGIQVYINIVNKGSDLIYRTSVGKIPFIHKLAFT